MGYCDHLVMLVHYENSTVCLVRLSLTGITARVSRSGQREMSFGRSQQTWEGPGLVGRAGHEAAAFSRADPRLGGRAPNFRSLGLGEKLNQHLASKHWLSLVTVDLQFTASEMPHRSDGGGAADRPLALPWVNPGGQLPELNRKGGTCRLLFSRTKGRGVSFHLHQ